MPLQIIHVVRELTDTGTPQRSGQRAFYYTGDSPSSSWTPNTDILETEDRVLIHVELAGVNREDLDVRLSNGMLTISGTRQDRRPSESVYFHQLEVHYGTFRKDIPIPEGLIHNEIEALVENGILEINISKKSNVIEVPINIDPSVE